MKSQNKKTGPADLPRRPYQPNFYIEPSTRKGLLAHQMSTS